MVIAYMNNINALKKEISAELSRLLDNILTPLIPLSTNVEKGKINDSLVSTSVEKREGVMRKGDEDIIAKMTQLYYLNLLQIENIKSLAPKVKEKVKQDILKDYKKNLMRVIYFTQYAGNK
jgi:hypothetical protein